VSPAGRDCAEWWWAGPPAGPVGARVGGPSGGGGDGWPGVKGRRGTRNGQGAPDVLYPLQIPEHFGAVRAIAEGPGSELLVGTTKNALLRGDLAQGFSPVIQVWGGPRVWGAGREELWGRGRDDSRAPLQGHTDELWGLCTHPFQNRFLTCGHDRQLCLWDGEGHALAWSIDLKVESSVSPDPRCHTHRDFCGHHSFPNIRFPFAPKGSHLALV